MARWESEKVVAVIEREVTLAMEVKERHRHAGDLLAGLQLPDAVPLAVPANTVRRDDGRELR
eukprot:5128626-Prymnesium_polylepis.1